VPDLDATLEAILVDVDALARAAEVAPPDGRTAASPPKHRPQPV
jgi:hypothetical protein